MEFLQEVKPLLIEGDSAKVMKVLTSSKQGFLGDVFLKDEDGLISRGNKCFITTHIPSDKRG